MAQTQRIQVVVVGGGQAGLAAGYFLRRANLDFVILDAEPEAGGSWQHTWPSLRLFSPANVSSLPGWQMPAYGPGNPDADHVIDYLTRYERRYNLPVQRPVRVERVTLEDGLFRVRTDSSDWLADAVVSATGTWSLPFVPWYGQDRFHRRQVHSAFYTGPEEFAGQRVLVVGGANSGAQIAADLVGTSAVTWCTLGEPKYLPDDVDGHELFRTATQHLRGEGGGVASLGDIVVLPPVKAARDAGLLVAHPMFDHFTETGVQWENGDQREIDAVIWCTGFRPALRHLAGLPLPREGKHIVTGGPLVPGLPGLYLIGYGHWSGAASATLVGVGQWARAAVTDLSQRLTADAQAITSSPEVSARVKEVS